MKYLNLTNTIPNLIEFFNLNLIKYTLYEFSTDQLNQVDLIICVENKIIILFQINLDRIGDIYSVFDHISTYLIDPILQSYCDMTNEENLLLFYNGSSNCSYDKKTLYNEMNTYINLYSEYESNQIDNLELCSDICCDIKDNLKI